MFSISLHNRRNHKTASLLLHTDYSLDALQEKIRVQLETGSSRVVGVFDESRGVFFSLSFLLTSPSSLSLSSSAAYSLVFEDGNDFTTDFKRKEAPRVETCENDDEEEDGDRTEDEEEEDYDFSETTHSEEPRNCTAPPTGCSQKVVCNLPIEFIDAHLKMLMDEVIANTKLNIHAVSQVFHALSLYADTTDLISKQSFLAGMSYLAWLDTSRRNDDADQVSNAMFERIFDAVHSCCQGSQAADDADSDPKVSIYHISLFLSLFCCTGYDDKSHQNSIKIMYNLFDFDRDGHVTLCDASNCFYVMIMCLLDLFSQIIFAIEEYPLFKNASLLTESLFGGPVTGVQSSKKIHYSQFKVWLESRDSAVLALNESTPSRPIRRGLKSKASNFLQAQCNLGLEGISPITLMKCLNYYASKENRSGCENDSMRALISHRGVFSAILLASKMESPNNVFSTSWSGLYEAEVILCEVMSLFDTCESGHVDRDDIFAALSVFCGGTFEERVQALFPPSSTYDSQQLVYVANERAYFRALIHRDQMAKYLLAVFEVNAVLQRT